MRRSKSVTNDYPPVAETKTKVPKGRRRMSFKGSSVEEIGTPIFKGERQLRRSVTSVGTTPCLDERGGDTAIYRAFRTMDPSVGTILAPRLPKKTIGEKKRSVMRRTKTLGDETQITSTVRMSKREEHRDLDGSENFWWSSSERIPSIDAVWGNSIPSYLAI